MKVKSRCEVIVCLLLFFSSLFACSKNDPSNNGNNGNSDNGDNNQTTTSAPTNLTIDAQIVGVSDSLPNGDGSGTVNLSLSATNATSFQVTLPTEDKTFTINGSSGNTVCTFASAPGTTSQYPIAITAYNNTVKKDSIIFVTVYCKAVAENLVWSDEFNGSSLDQSIWNYEIGNLNVNNEQEYYTSDAANVSVKDGYLQITALNSPNYNNSGWNYTSARITTANKYSFKYGKVEMRAKLPGDKGTWPALWMLGNDINTGTGWPACGEIDIMEMGTVTGLDNVLSSLHWGGDYSKSRIVSGSTTDFHLYQMDWRADHISFSIDDTLLYTWTNSSSMPFNQNFFFIFNVAVGGNMGGNTITLGSGSTMYVDYVRVYN